MRIEARKTKRTAPARSPPGWSPDPGVRRFPQRRQPALPGCLRRGIDGLPDLLIVRSRSKTGT